MKRAVVILALLLAGCHPEAADDDDELNYSTSPPPGGLPVPLVRQATDYSCGPAALASVLAYWRVFDGREEELYAPLGTTVKDGTEPYALEQLARTRFHLAAEYRTGVALEELRSAVGRGETVILDLQAWPDQEVEWSDDWVDGHYVVLVAMDEDTLWVMDPSEGGYVSIDADEFVERWHDVETRAGVDRRLQHMAVFFSAWENEEKL
jgi:predicted double-glycine peptidase